MCAHNTHVQQRSVACSGDKYACAVKKNIRITKAAEECTTQGLYELILSLRTIVRFSENLSLDHWENVY